MRSVGGAIEHLSGQLNDQRHNKEFTRWSRAIWLEYLNEGLIAIGAYRPEAFATEQEITLVPGSRQTSTGSVTSISANADGTPVSQTDAGLSTAFGTYFACAADVEFKDGAPTYRLRSASIDAKNSHVFYVEPAVPHGVTAKVIATTQSNPPVYTFADWDTPIAMQPKFYNNLLDFMQARAYELDNESPMAFQNSQKFYKHFYEAMGVNYKMESAYRSGYYKGETGTGDPRSRQ